MTYTSDPDRKMMLYGSKQMFTEENCDTCLHTDLPESERPCRGHIPVMIKGMEWYPDYCPFKAHRSAFTDTDRDPREIVRDLFGDGQK